MKISGINLLSKEEIQNALSNISKKLFRIEDRDDRFSENKTWMRLRAQTEFLYTRLKEIEVANKEFYLQNHKER